ncbi:MobF family relaxase [Streptomyces sp. NPDC088733]|uniref:MobF family relaxase n=1 Tax=Streptomyces sp. NPDC088733 TaxID=3365880 RepID=UPI0037F4A7BC
MNAVGKGAEHYYLKAIEQAGEPAGLWLGDGAADLGLTGEVDHEVMAALYGQFTDPRRLEEARTVTEARWEDFRAAHPDLRVGTAAYAKARASIEAEVRAEYRLGSAIRDYSKSTEKRVAEALAELPAGATPEKRRAVEMGVRANAQQNRMYYDATFSAPKSWSLLHASLQIKAAQSREAGDLEAAQEFAGQADQVWAAWMEGVEAGLQYLQDEAGYAREGRFAGKGGTTGRRVDAHEFTVAAFRQHTSRDEDPQLHVHAAILNRVKVEHTDPVTGEVTEKWLALDGQQIYKQAKAAGHLSERVAEEALVRRLGVRVATRPDGVAREIVGIEQELRDQYSSRRRVVTEKVADLARKYEERNGVAPGAHQLAKMAQFVVLDERKAKTEATSREDLLARWEAACVEELRGSLADVPQQVRAASDELGVEAVPFDPTQVVRNAVLAVQAEKSTWTKADLMVQVARELPDCLGGLESYQVTHLVRELTEAATAPDAGTAVVRLTPPELIPVPKELQLANGQSRYSDPSGDRYTTDRTLQREANQLEYAQQLGAPQVDVAAIEEALARVELNEGQEAAFRGILGSGQKVEILVGPAGTGKSRLNAAVNDAWKQHVGTPVLGLASSQRAARVLQEEGVDQVENISMFLLSNKNLADGISAPQFERYRLQPGQLVIVDEAAMTETDHIDQIRRLAEAAGAKVILSGDHFQLDAVGAGGMFREMAEQLPNVHVLDDVMRFSSEWERDASLKLRTGDTSVLVAYDDRGRLLGGSREDMMRTAYQGWLADHMAGRDALLIAATNEQADHLSALARQDLVRFGEVEPGGIELPTRGITIGIGDTVQLRNNNRTLTTANGRWAVNRDVVRVTDRFEDGSVTVAYEDGQEMRLPAGYVREHVDLAYAGTVHAAQGRTVDVCHSLVDGAQAREGFYVAMTRGRHGNYAYVVTEQEGVRPEQQPDLVAVLQQTLEASDAQPAATAVLREELERSVSLDRWTTILEDLQIEHAGARYGQVLFEALGEDGYRQIRDEAAYGSLLQLARSAEFAGHDAEQLLTSVTEADLSDAKTLSSVLHYRLTREIERADRALVREAEQQVREAVVRQQDAVKEVFTAAPGIEDSLQALVDQQMAAMTELEVLHGGQAEQTRHELSEARLQEAEERSRWDARVAEMDGPVGEYAQQAAEMMESRRLELGRQLADADERPEWAERLGPVPTSEAWREAWIEHAGTVAAYREAHGYDSERDAIGEAPPQHAVDVRADWERAFRALGEPEDRMDLVGASEHQLREQVARYEREETWAPRYVAEQLREDHQAAREAHRQAAQLQVQASEAADDMERARLQAEAAEQAQIAQNLAERAERLEKVHSVREDWHEHTEEVRERAQAARRELELRGVDLQDQEQDVAPEQETEPQEPTAEQIAEDREVGVEDPQEPVVLDGPELDGAVDQAASARQELDGREEASRAMQQARQDQVIEQAAADIQAIQQVREPVIEQGGYEVSM